jgi:hypothetical protein
MDGWMNAHTKTTTSSSVTETAYASVILVFIPLFVQFMEPTWKARSIGYIIDFELNKIFIMVLLTSAPQH